MIDPATLRTVFMGTPDFAVPTLEVLLQAGLNLVGVYTQPDRPKGRGQALAAPPVKEMALRHGIPVLQPQKLRAPEVVEELRALVQAGIDSGPGLDVIPDLFLRDCDRRDVFGLEAHD